VFKRLVEQIYFLNTGGTH